MYSKQLLFHEYGFDSLNELLQRVPKVELVKPPSKSKLIVRIIKSESEVNEQLKIVKKVKLCLMIYDASQVFVRNFDFLM